MSTVSTFTNLVFGVIRWLILGLLVVATLFIAWRYREQIAWWFQQVFREWRAFWEQLLGRDRVDRPAAIEGPHVPPPPGFSDYPDPFATGTAARQSAAELVRYSFAALEAWARDRGVPRGVEQTPLEFAQQLGQYEATLSREARGVAELYCQLAYSAGSLPGTAIGAVQQLWLRMGAPTPPPWPPAGPPPAPSPEAHRTHGPRT